MGVAKALWEQPPFSDTLSVILPVPEQTWLLRACLHSGESGRKAWEAWRERVGDLRIVLGEDRRGVKTLAPLLLMAQRRNALAIEHSLLTYLRTAYLREELRSRIYRGTLRSILAELAAKGIPHIVLKGAALSETAYRNQALRHSHDIDILLGENDLSRATNLAASAGFMLSRAGVSADPHHVTLIHESGLPLELHSRLFRILYYDAPLADIWARSQSRAVAHTPTRILSPADNLLHVCGLASCSGSSESLRWVCDAWHIIANDRDLDWQVLFGCALRSHLALPLFVTLGYLADHLDAPIPASLLDRLGVAASEADANERETAVFGAVTAMRGEVAGLIRMTGGWWPRTRLVTRMLFPSPRHLRWAYHVRSPWLLPFCYLYRPLKFASGRVWFHCKSRFQRTVFRKDLLSERVATGG